jgi:hypothetical protein
VLTRLPWALANSVLWLAAGAAGITAAISPDAEVRVVAVIAAMSLAVGWAAHMLADHYDEVIDENDMLHGQREVVFGDQAEAEHAAFQRLTEELRVLGRRGWRAKLHIPRRARPELPLGPGSTATWVDELADMNWSDDGALSDR